MLSCGSVAFVALLCSLSGTASAGSSADSNAGFVESLLASFSWQTDAAAGSSGEETTAASDAAADAPICFEAFVTEYPRCEEYVAQGYTCVGGWCAVDRCVGHCHECARKYEGSVVDVQTGRCTSDLWLTARKAKRIFFEMMPAIEAGRRAAGAAVGGGGGAGVGSSTAGQMVLASLQTLLSLAALFFLYKVVALVLSVLRAAVSFTTGLVLGFGSFILLDLYFPAAMQVLRSSAETGVAWFAACFAV